MHTTPPSDHFEYFVLFLDEGGCMIVDGQQPWENVDRQA
jgi:hypothetical protein